MAKLMKLRLGVADDPTALQPTLHDCLAAMLQQADLLMTDVINGLVLTTSPSSSHRIAGFQTGPTRAAIESLQRDTRAASATYMAELTRIVYHGGGKEQQHTEALRFEDLQLFEDAELDQSIEVARAQQEVSIAVDDVLPVVDALVSTLLGWRTIQPGLNPVRPEVFVRALQATLAIHLPEPGVREALITPAAGLLGANLRKLYRELSEWLLSTGVEPAVPLGGKVAGPGGARTTVNDSIAKTLLTLDKLRKLLAGDFDSPKPRAEFLHTVPASMALLQEMKAEEALVRRLEKRPAPAPAGPAPQTLEEQDAAAALATPLRLGEQLGEEVVRLLFDNLAGDARLLAPVKRELAVMAPAVLQLAKADSRFFSDRNHPARQLLDRITQRSLAYRQDNDPGFQRYMQTVGSIASWMQSKVIDADLFGELLERLQSQWVDEDQAGRQRREEAARALLAAEQRNLLAQKLGAEFTQQLDGLEVADFVADFLRSSWAQVVAAAQLSCANGESDPKGYRAVVDDLVWSVQKSTSRRGRRRRLVQMIPGLLAKLREGLKDIHYPPELTQRFFDHLITIHRDAVQDGADPDAAAAAQAAEAEGSRFDMDDAEAAMWMAQEEVMESGYLGADSFLPPDAAEQADAFMRQEEARAAALAAQQLPQEPVAQAAPVPEAPAEAAPPIAAPAPAPAPVEPVGAGVLRTGSWVELSVDRQWTRMQLTWASPHGTLFMFTSINGTAHSMSRRTLERLRADGLIRVVAERNVVDEALDQVAKAALKNSLGAKG
jgi:hypothetical protein